MKTLAGADHAIERRTKAALAILLALAIAMISLGISGIQALARSGFDDAIGFGFVRSAGQMAATNVQQDAALIKALGANEQSAVESAVDAAIRGLWQRVRYNGETTQDFARADSLKRQNAMQALLYETQDAALQQSVSRAAAALKTMREGMTEDGMPAYEKLLHEVAALLPDHQAQPLLKQLADTQKNQSSAVQEDIKKRGQALFENAVAEKRLSRFTDAGAGLIPVGKALFEALHAAAPESDLSSALQLLKKVPRQPEAYASLFELSTHEAISKVLSMLDGKEIAGARLVSFNKEMYSLLKQYHPNICAFDHLPLIALQADAMEAEPGDELRHQADLLSAMAWNDALAPLLQEAVFIAGQSVSGGEAAMLSAISSVLSGKDVKSEEDTLVAQLIAQRDADTAASIDRFLGGMQGENVLNTKLMLLQSLFVFDAPQMPSALQKHIGTLNDTDRTALRQAVLARLSGAEATLPEAVEKVISKPDTTSEEYLLFLFLSSRTPEAHIFSEETDTGLRLAIRQNGARIRAAQTVARGGGSALMQRVNSHGKTLTLLGALLFINVLLLFFMMRSGRDWRFDVKWLFILLIVDFMLVFQILPLGFLLFKAIKPGDSFSLVTFGRLFSYNMNRSALVNTIVGGLAAMVLGTVIAFPLAWMVGRTNMYGKKFFRHVFVLTYMVPPYVGAMAWLRLLNPNVGTINIMLRTIFNIDATAGPINVYSLTGLVWVLTTFYYPYAFITISRAMEKMDPSLEEASRISGASPFLTLMRVTLPIMTPSIIAGALLVFVSAASCYGIPSIIGAPGRVHTVTTRIIEYYGRGTQGLNDATGLAVFLMALAILILYLSDFVIAKKQYITVSGKSTRPNIVDLRAWRWPLTLLVALFAVMVVLVPFATILTTSLKIDVGKSLFSKGNFTFSQWSTIFSRSETISSLKNSLIYAAVSATVGILVAITMSYLMQRTRIRGRRLPDFLITLGSGSPSVVIALGLIMTMQGRFGVNIYNTAYILIVAYLIKYMMMGMRTVTSAVSQIHVSLEESSQVSGASWMTTMRRITGPLIFPSIAAGWFLIFIPCFYELSMTTLLYSNTTKTIGFQLFEYWTFTSQPQASALAFGILLIVILINQFFNRLTKGEFTI